MRRHTLATRRAWGLTRKARWVDFCLELPSGGRRRQSSGRAAKAFLVFIYHPIPDMGFFHLSCMLFRALLCVSSPPATISFKWLSSAFITSSAVFPWNGTSHGPPICLQVIVFISLISFHGIQRKQRRDAPGEAHTERRGLRRDSRHRPQYLGRLHQPDYVAIRVFHFRDQLAATDVLDVLVNHRSRVQQLLQPRPDVIDLPVGQGS